MYVLIDKCIIISFNLHNNSKWCVCYYCPHFRDDKMGLPPQDTTRKWSGRTQTQLYALAEASGKTLNKLPLRLNALI